MTRALLILMLAGFPLLSGAESNLPDAPHIYVQGKASTALEPELLILSGQIVGEDRQVTVASQQVEDQSAALIGLMESLEVERDDVRASMPVVEQVFEYQDGRNLLVGYRVRREVEIRLSKMDRYHLDYAEIIRSGALASLSARFSVRDPEAATDAAQLAAVDDARARAERLAERAGASLGEIHSMTEFDLRRVERPLLTPARRFSESALGQGGDGIYTSATRMEAAPPIFEPEALTAEATVFVVYLLDQ
jgi:uncharacterized protein YggE